MRLSQRRVWPARLVTLLLLLVFAPLAWFLSTRLEGEKPVVKLDPDVEVLGIDNAITLEMKDPKSGLREFSIVLEKDGKIYPVAEEKYDDIDLLKGSSRHDERVSLKIVPKAMGISEGDLIFRLKVRDASWRRWFNGNLSLIEKRVTVDTRSPEVTLLSDAHNIAPGGAGLAVYRLSEDCVKSGVQVGDRFFPGYLANSIDQWTHLAFFALDPSQTKETEMAVIATDRGGNTLRKRFPHYIRGRVFKKDRIILTNEFLSAMIPEFESQTGSLGAGSDIEKFLVINNKMRKEDYELLTHLYGRTEPVLRWEGAFLRMPNSAPKAGFADLREYVYNGKIIDHQVHLGVDLAATARYSVPAANSGKVIYCESVGIYGNTVVLDHGFGLFSLYAHLSEISVAKGEEVKKGAIIGKTGTTGLAGGDHLHFSMMVHDTFVTPVEWWDGDWIANNVSSKLKRPVVK